MHTVLSLYTQKQLLVNSKHIHVQYTIINIPSALSNGIGTRTTKGIQYSTNFLVL